VWPLMPSMEEAVADPAQEAGSLVILLMYM
jgi:hypothetical protein